jgi:bifunctional non-homologous end joining protein LigD
MISPLRKSFTFSTISNWPLNLVVDGEIVVLDKKGLPDFAALQSWRSEADGRLCYFVFDLLWFNGNNLMKVPLVERRRILKEVLPSNPNIRFSDDFEVSGNQLFKLIDQMGLEGIIAKKADSLYKPGSRSKDWLKIKTQRFQEVVIGGYTINENTSKVFSALLMGIYEQGEFRFIGTVGTGFTTKVQKQILKKLKPLIRSESPFANEPEYNKPSRFRPNPPKAEVIWVKPEVVAEISYRTVSPDGSFRHPSFKGIREEKEARKVGREAAVPVDKIVEGSSSLKNKIAQPAIEAERKTMLNPSEETQTRTINSRLLKFPNLSKIYWPDQKVSKRDMINFYYQVAPYILPYLKNRPHTLNRYPNGIKGKSFYQKDVTGKAPDWLKTYSYFSEADQRQKHFPVVTDEASLLYLASLACIEMNPWSSRIDKPDHPDWCIIDLDPDQNPFEQVIETACVTKDVLDAIEVPACCKTSGSTGLHIYLPLGAKYTYEESKEFGRALVKVIQPKLPEITSIERYTSKRKGKIYLDFLQNRPKATVAAPYSLRPKPGAPVSMPVHWDEVRKGLKIRDFNIHNSIERLKEQGDIFSGVLGKGIDMEKALKKLKDI